MRGQFALVAALAAASTWIAQPTATAQMEPDGASRATVWYWSPGWCKSMLHRGGVQLGDGRTFAVQQAYCLGVGGPQTCSWNGTLRTYKSFLVYVRSYDGTVRSFTLHPSGKNGFGGANMRSYGKMALDRFIGFTLPFVANAARAEQAKGCSGG